MTDPVEAPPPEIPPEVPLAAPPAQAPEAPAPKAPPAPKPARPVLPFVVGLGFLVLAAAQAALWVRVLQPAPPASSPDARIPAIEARLSRLEARPVAAAPDLGPLNARVTALEQRKPTAPNPPPAPPGAPSASPSGGPSGGQAAGPAGGPTDGLAERLTANEARLAALEKSATTPAPAKELADRVTADESRLTALEKTAAAPPPNDGLADRVGADEARLAALEKSSAIPAQLAERAARTGRLQAAFAALAAGQPLGDIPQAPAALARYATIAPPTEPALRLAFPAASRVALAAGQPASSSKPFLDRMWAEAQDLVTIRQGDRVLLGDPNAGVLAHAQTALDAGDLAGAVTVVATLTGPAAQAMAPWLEQARGLLAARAALADLATRP
jgi:hypothetical protein